MRKIREKLNGRPLRQPQPPKVTPVCSSVAPPQPSRPPNQASPPPPAPVLTISPAALATLTWAAQRSENECCLWGVLGATGEDGLRLAGGSHSGPPPRRPGLVRPRHGLVWRPAGQVA